MGRAVCQLDLFFAWLEFGFEQIAHKTLPETFEVDVAKSIAIDNIRSIVV